MRGMARKPKPKPTPQEQAEIETLRQAANITALTELLSNRRKLFWTNFVAGLARGVGFFLGVTLVGALVIGLFATLFDRTAQRLGFKDVTMKDMIRAAVVKFEEIRREVEDVRAELRAEPPPPELRPADPQPEATAEQTQEPPPPGALQDQ